MGKKKKKKHCFFSLPNFFSLLLSLSLSQKPFSLVFSLSPPPTQDAATVSAPSTAMGSAEVDLALLFFAQSSPPPPPSSSRAAEEARDPPFFPADGGVLPRAPALPPPPTPPRPPAAASAAAAASSSSFSFSTSLISVSHLLDSSWGVLDLKYQSKRNRNDARIAALSSSQRP